MADSDSDDDFITKQLSIVEKSFGSSPSPRALWQTHGGSSSPAAAADNVHANSGEGLHGSDDDDDDDVVAVATLSNASAFGNDDASSGDSSGGDDDSNQASPHVAASIGTSSALDPENDDVQRLLLQGDVEGACSVLVDRNDHWRALHVFMSHDRFPQAAAMLSSAKLLPSSPPPHLSPDLLKHAASALALDMQPLARHIYVSLGKWRELYTLLCKQKAWGNAAVLARDQDSSLKPTATTLPSLTVLQGSPWFQARVSQASSLGVDLPVLLKVFQAPPVSAASPLMQASAAPVNMMAQYVAAAGFVSFAGDLCTLFPVDVRNAAVYSKAAAAIEDHRYNDAEDILGAAGLWVCAAEMYRIYGSDGDFKRVAQEHAPHLLKAAVARAGGKSEQSNGAGQSAISASDALLKSSSEPDHSSNRVSFPAPPPPLRSGLLRARFFIPASCAASCCCLWIALLGYAVKLPCVDCTKAAAPSPPDSVVWGVPVTLALNLWIISSCMLAWVVHERRSYYSLVFASIPRVLFGCVAFIAAAVVAFAQGYAAGFAHVTPLQMKGTTAAWELLVCAGIGLLISGISDGMSNFFVVVTCVAVAVSWLTFSNVVAALLFLMMYVFLLMIRLYRAIGGALSILAPVPLVVLHLALGLIANVYPSQPLHVTRLLVGVPVGLLLICEVFWTFPSTVVFELQDVISDEAPPNDPLELPTGAARTTNTMVTHSPPPTNPRPSQQPQKQAVRPGFSGFIDTFSSAAAGVASSPSEASSARRASVSTSAALAAPVVPSEDGAFALQTSDQSIASSPLPPPRSVVIPPPPFSPPPDMSLNESAAITIPSPPPRPPLPPASAGPGIRTVVGVGRAGAGAIVLRNGRRVSGAS